MADGREPPEPFGRRAESARGEQGKRKPAHERRAELLDHAVRSYLELGIGRAGHGDVAKRAGVSTGTVFNYFPTREALTDAVLAHVSEVILRFFNYVSTQDSIEATLDHYREALIGSCERAPNEIKLFLTWANSFSPDVRPAYLELQDEIIARISAHTGGEATVARVVFGAGQMFMQMVFDGTSTQALKDFADRVGWGAALAAQAREGAG